jgi:hypothetical protein
MAENSPVELAPDAVSHAFPNELLTDAGPLDPGALRDGCSAQPTRSYSSSGSRPVVALSNPTAGNEFRSGTWEPKVLGLKTGGSSAYCGAVADQVKPVTVFRSPKATVRILKE